MGVAVGSVVNVAETGASAPAFAFSFAVSAFLVTFSFAAVFPPAPAVLGPNNLPNKLSTATAKSLPFAHRRSGTPVFILARNDCKPDQSVGASEEMESDCMYDSSVPRRESGVKETPAMASFEG